MCRPPASVNEGEFANSAHWVTSRIAVGMYLSPERASHLRSRGITHIFNVGENPSIVHKQEFGLTEITDCPIVDLARIPDEIALHCVATILAMLRSSPESKVYVHCLAGQNRSPTVVWLYLVACGLDPKTGKRLITDRVCDSEPGHSALVDDRLIQRVIEFGRLNGLTLDDAGIVETDK